MPNKQNAKKALRQAKKRTTNNLVVKKHFKLAVKEVKKGISAGEKELVEKLRLAQKALDKAAKKGVIKANTAARLLSRLSNQLKKMTKTA